MKRTIRLGILLLIGVLLLVMLISLSRVTFSLGSSDREMTFVVLDVDTGQPIPKAAIVLIEEGKPERTVNLLTDEQGTAKLFREGLSQTDVSGPLRETRTIYKFPWSLITASARGYAPLDYVWFQTISFEDHGRSEDGRFIRLEFKVRMARAKPR